MPRQLLRAPLAPLASRKASKPLTRLSRITTRDTRAHLLVVDEPLEQAAHNAPPLLECRLFPHFLRLRRSLDLALYLILVVREVRANVQPCRGVE